MTSLKRNNVQSRGSGLTPMLFAHGFGCDQNMWRFVAPAFEDRYQTILFDSVGAGGSDLSAYSFEKYSTLEGYADDIVEIGHALQIKNGIFIGHSVSAMTGLIAVKKAPGMFSSIVMVGPSPCYIDSGDYIGGFTRPQIDELLALLDDNYLAWSATMAPAIMGNSDRPALGDELTNSFCRTDPAIAKHFARTTFLSDWRHILPDTRVPSLILQCSDDVIAPLDVGHYMNRQMPQSTLVVMKATGHCPNLSAPEETIRAIKEFLTAN